MADIDALTFPEFSLLTRYWQDSPPPHLLLAAALGLKPQKRGGLEELMEAFGTVGGVTTPVDSTDR